ncbi:MAG: mycothiol system anti-sigma-R factor [Nocardioides sp.]
MNDPRLDDELARTRDAAAKSAAECADFLQRIVFLVDNELCESDVTAVRIHLDGCNPCHETYELQRRIKGLVARCCHETAPESLRERISLQVRQWEIRIEE